MAPITGGGSLLAQLIDGEEWYIRAETALVRGLEDDIDLATFDQAVLSIDIPFAPLADSGLGTLGRTAIAMAETELRRQGNALPPAALGLAWTAGGEDCPATVIAFDALPSGAFFTSFIDGLWGDRPQPDISVIPAPF
jgi:hypothetical protein